MDLPAVSLLCLEHKQYNLKDHNEDFLDLVCLNHYRDCLFVIQGPLMILGEFLLHLWSGCWGTICLLSWTSPVPLRTKTPTSRLLHPAGRLYQSPPQTRSPTLPRYLCQS